MEYNKLNDSYYIETFEISSSKKLKKPTIEKERYERILHYTDYSFPLVAKVDKTYFEIEKSENIENSNQLFIPQDSKRKINSNLPSVKNVLILSEKTRKLKDFMGFQF